MTQGWAHCQTVVLILPPSSLKHPIASCLTDVEFLLALRTGNTTIDNENNICIMLAPGQPPWTGFRPYGQRFLFSSRTRTPRPQKETATPNPERTRSILRQGFIIFTIFPRNWRLMGTRNLIGFLFCTKAVVRRLFAWERRAFRAVMQTNVVHPFPGWQAPTLQQLSIALPLAVMPVTWYKKPLRQCT